MPNQPAGPGPELRAGYVTDDTPMMEVMTTGRATLDQQMTSNVRISDGIALAGSAELRHRFEEAARATVMSLNAYMARGAPEDVTVSATARAHAVAQGTSLDSVWAAVCVLWLAPALRWLADKTDPRDVTSWRMRLTRLFDRWADWCDSHGRVVVATTADDEQTETETRTVYRKVCPHIGVPAQQRGGYDLHVQWMGYGWDLDDPDAPPLQADDLMQRMMQTVHDRRDFPTQPWGLTEDEYATLAYADHVPLWPDPSDPPHLFGIPVRALNVNTLRPRGTEGRVER